MPENVKEKSWSRRALRYLPLLFWIVVIFYFSSGAGSMSETSRFILPVLRFFLPEAPDESLIQYLVLIRKLAHVTVYAVLALLGSIAFATSSISAIKRYWPFAAIFLAVVIAIADETGQAYTPGRTGSIWDVLLDTVGAVGMAGIVYLFIKKYRARRNIQDPDEI